MTIIDIRGVKVTPYYDDGRILIYHADSRNLVRMLPTPDLVLTDPPYGISLEEHGRNGYDWTVAGDNDQSLGQHILDVCAEHKWPVITFASPKRPWSGTWRQHLAWDKGPAVGGGGDPQTCWKPTWELIQVARTPRLNGKRDSAVLVYWVGQTDYHWHPCQKPVSLLSYLIGKTTAPNAVILDPFMGSGSMLRAAKDLGRKAIGIEIEERYCEIAARRLQQSVLPLEIAQ